MAEGDRATVDVDFVRVDLQIADRAQHDGGKGLVDLEQIDIRRVHAGLLQRLERGWRDAGQHDRRLGADHRRRTDPRTRLDAELRSEEHTSELQSLMRISYAVFCLKKNKNIDLNNTMHIIK